MNQQPVFSNHAMSRQQQRGHSLELLTILLNYGRTSFAQGAWQVDMGKREIQNLLRDEPSFDRQLISKLKKMYLVDGARSVITSGYKRSGWGRRFSGGKNIPRGRRLANGSPMKRQEQF